MGALRVSLCSTDDHLFVPTCVPWRKAASGGQGWPKVTAERREASLRAAGRLATLTTVGSLGEASASRDPYRAREAEPGSPSKTVIANPADIVALLSGNDDVLALGMPSGPVADQHGMRAGCHLCAD